MSATPRFTNTGIAYYEDGFGEPLLIVGGALRTANDYEPLATALAAGHHHVVRVERRGRVPSPVMDDSYTIDLEVDDIAAVQAVSHATCAFGHSYGGLVLLETQRRLGLFSQIVVYEPGVSRAGSIPTAWMASYRAALASGDRRGAFTDFVRGSGHAPAALRRAPRWYARAILRLVVRGRQWESMAALLEENLREHEQVARLDGDLSRFESTPGRVDLLAGSRSPAEQTAVLRELCRVLPDATLTVLDGFGHNAPDSDAPIPVARRVLELLRAPAGESTQNDSQACQ